MNNDFQEDPLLEKVSDMIRRGIPVTFLEAVAAINYQEKKEAHLHQQRMKKWWYRLWKRIT